MRRGTGELVTPYRKRKAPTQGESSIKQVLTAANIVGRWLAAAENKQYRERKRREMNPRPTTKGVRTFCSYSFLHILLCKV